MRWLVRDFGPAILIAPATSSSSVYRCIWFLGMRSMVITLLVQFHWEGENPLHFIALKELFPIVLACAVWGRRWTGTYIMCHSDNEAVVSQVNWLHARDHLASHLLRYLALFIAKFDFRLRAVHIAGKLNTGADHLSRGRAQSFLATHHLASPLPTQVPQELVDMFLHPQHDWTSPLCRQLCSSFWRKA